MKSISDSSAAPFVHLGVDSIGTVVTTLPCRQCGYDLHGLHENGRCPECGVPVGLSLRGDLLQFSQPGWVESLRQGVKLVLWSMVVTVVGVLLQVVLAALFHQRSAQPAMMIVIFIGGIISFVGTWRLTAPDPSGVGEDQYGTSRKLIRIGLAVGLSNYALNFIKSTITLPPVPAMMLECLSAGVGLFAMVASIALMYYLSKLALRIPDLKLSARAKFLMYAMGISQLISLLFTYAMPHLLLPAIARGAGRGLVVFGLFSAVIGLCTLVFAVMYLFLLLRLGKRFKEAAASACLIWQVSPD